METLRFKKLNKHIGVELQGFSDITQLKEKDVAALKQLISDYSIVVIKGKRKWTEKEQIAFTSALGEIELPVVYSIPPAQVERKKSNVRVTKGSGVFWHSDNSYQERPSHLSTFQMIEIPESGTATSFASLINLSINLPEKDKMLWRDYGVVYRDKVVHPLLWKHPFVGKDSIYFDIGFSTDILNHCDSGRVLPVKQSNQIFNYINERLSKEESLLVHHWEEGDIVILDNYAVAHRADILLENEKRTLLRMTTLGIYF
ncbi:TauD/TfdA family dioxygenase [uncultured Aquimarina sp.]|uniref:TauD/TfdA dioxygenase family protein n=1 Tax=uncultured Aquimarina sp. TaxID=575652 RepID=UPI0026038F2F|nr:TauD/TfdA family dioxygenase [uncultured Aquimarina sp.]